MKTRTVALAAAMLIAVLFGLWYVSGIPSSAPEGPPQATEGGFAVGELPVEDAASDEVVSQRQVLDVGEDRAETGSLLVQVTWQDTGEPAAHVGLRLQERDGWFSMGQLQSTGDDGAARFDDVEPGGFEVTIDRPSPNGHDSPDVDVVAGEEAVLELEVAPGVDVRGIVVDRDGVAVAGAEVLVAWGGFSPQWTYPTTSTDVDGTFFLRCLGSLNLVGARADGHGTSNFALVQSSRREAGPEISMRLVLPGSPATLTGTVYDPEGTPVSGAWVEVGRYSPGSGPTQVIRLTDGQGRFEADSLQPGTTRVLAYREGFAAWRGEVDCPPWETTDVSIFLETGASLAGRVTDRDGRPMEGVWVNVSGVPGPQPSSASSDEEGRFRVEHLPPGEFDVVAESRGQGDTKATLTFAVGEETRWDVTLDPGLEILGILRNHLGEPLEGWWIRTDDGQRGGSTDSDGRFVIVNCEERPYTLRFYEGFDFRPITMLLEGVRPGGPELAVTVPEEALPSATIVGRVLTPEGRPAGGVDLSLRQWNWPISRTPVTDSEGRFEIGPLPPGTYQLAGWHPDYVSAEIGEVVLAAKEVSNVGDARLRHGARLEVTLLSPKPGQLEGLQVRVVDEDGESIKRGNLQGGGFVFPQVRAGSWMLSIEGPNVTSQRLPIELTAQETLSVEVTLR